MAADGKDDSVFRHEMAHVNGISMHIVKAGPEPSATKKPPVILAHGFPHTWWSWNRQMRVLADHGYPCIAYDIRGMGGTDVPSDPAEYDVDHTIGDLTGLLKHLKLEKAVFAGLDFGLFAIFDLAYRQPEKIIAQIALNKSKLDAYEAIRRPATAALVMANRQAGPEQSMDIVAEQLADLLRPWAGRFERGVWDYVETHSEAEEEWTRWTQGTVADAIEPKPNRGPYRGTREHMFVSVLLLLVKGGSSDSFVCERCRIPEDRMWKQATFMYLLDGISMLNFSTVRADAIYVRPGLSAGAVSEEELGEDHYDYLRTLTA